MAVTHAKTKRWDRSAYQSLGELNVLHPDERVELIEGEIVKMSPQGPQHAALIRRLTHLLVSSFGATHVVAPQCPLDLGEYSQPEPDFALIPVADDPGEKALPARADLVIEVAVSTLAYDRSEKASLYAKFGISELWIVNVPDQCVEVYRQATPDVESPFGHRYAEFSRFGLSGEVSPWWDPELRISVARILG